MSTQLAERLRQYSLEQREAILDHVIGEIATGRALSRIFLEDDGMPAEKTFWMWHFHSVEWQQKVAHARELGVEAIFAQVVDIADTQHIGETTITKANGDVEVRKEDMLGHRKLRVETRIKYAQMIAPRKYGPKVDVTSGGEALAAPSQHIDHRIQSIVMQAQQRLAKGGGLEGLTLSDEAKDLLG